MSTDAPPAATVVRDEAAQRVAEQPSQLAQPESQPSRPKAVLAPSTAWRIPLAVLIGGMFMSVLDVSIVNVAISTIQVELGGSTADVAWISTAYTLVLGVVVPTSAWLGNRFGLGRVYTLSLAGFAITSALCGLAWSLNSLIAFRVVQAIPAGCCRPSP